MEENQRNCVDQMSKELQLPEIQSEVKGAMSTPLIKLCVSEYEGKCQNEDSKTGNSQNHIRKDLKLPGSLSAHRLNKSLFITQLLKNTELIKCLYKVLVLNDQEFTVFYCFKRVKDFLPLDFLEKLVKLEKLILDLKSSTRHFVNTCTSTAQELTERRGKVNKSVIAGSTIGILGGGLAIAGLILTPFTFGASLGLTIAGASLGASGGIVGGTARVVEGVKQNLSTKEIKEFQSTITTQENNLVILFQDITSMISHNLDRHLDHTVEGPGINRRGFLAIGSAVRALHGGVAVGLAAARVGAAGAAIAAATLGPVSLLLDVGFLAEAAHNLRKGSKTGAGEILEQNAKADTFWDFTEEERRQDELNSMPKVTRRLKMIDKLLKE